MMLTEIAFTFFTRNASGAKADADAIPTGVVSIDGEPVGDVPSIVPAAGVGHYAAALLLNAESGQSVWITLDALVGANPWHDEVTATILPPNFNALGIDPAGSITRVVANTDMRGTDNALLSADAPAAVRTGAGLASANLDVQLLGIVVDNERIIDLTLAIQTAAEKVALAFDADGTLANSAESGVGNAVADNPTVQEIKAKTDLITTSTVVVRSGVAADGKTISIVQGDTYSGNEIEWTGAAPDQWPDLTGATLAFRATMAGSTPITGTPEVTSATGIQKFQLPLTSPDTSKPPGTYRYDVEATWPSETPVRVKTLVKDGAFIVGNTFTNEP